MIGKVMTGKSMRGCLNYCLDKKQAEVLDQNMCGGNKKEMLDQMRDVRNQNRNLEKTVQHITLSMAPGEQLSKSDLIKLAEECAKEIGFDKHQYVVIQHHDTGHQHIHIVINRVGLDGKTLSDSNNYKKLAEFCRKMEEKFKLKKVLNPRRFQSQAQRQLPRSDERKAKLKAAITECLWKADSYEEFARLMKLKGYDIDKARGIAFEDEKKVRIKGSEVGYSWSKIEKVLAQKKQKQELIIKRVPKGEQQKKLSPLISKKLPTGLLQKKSSGKETILDMLTGKPAFEENVNHQFKKKKQQQRRQQ